MLETFNHYLNLLLRDEFWIGQIFLIIFGALLLDFFMYTFTRTTEWIKYHEVKQDVLFRINDIINAHGADIAFPTRTVHLSDVNSQNSAAGILSKSA